MRDKLYQAALKGRENSYSPYSNFAVGAAVLCGDKIYTGCNVENGSYGLTICAERCAIWKAVSEGERKFDAICVVADTSAPVSPCGACRQVMSEFKIPRIILSNLKGDFKEFTLEEILPYEFKL
ncbi:MAG: cytidine deaminase [Phascolarctobacterium sp.]|nr:cytidine deaminase [Phascolarctobacterium sp.]